MTTPLLEVAGLTRRFHLAHGLLQPPRLLTALDDVGFTLAHGRSLGVVGGSGSGKSTLARLVMALDKPDAGTVRLDGEDLNALPPAELRRRRRKFQMVFQDPRGSLDPRMRVEAIVAEPLDVAEPGLGLARRERIASALEAVGLDRSVLRLFPHQFSGGQRQRIAIARALVTAPALVVADEPVSALDVSVQAQVLNLMMDLQRERGLAYLFISHDLAVVEHIADEVIVMHRGRIVEHGSAEALFRAPTHPYTLSLVEAISPFDRMPVDAAAAPDRPPRPSARETPPLAEGCSFAGACRFATSRCHREAPQLTAISDDRRVACFTPLG
ncbi:MAG: ATP-binding cassette domain-containing protein [Ancalomicrobiaceae bacterium]|nr:ATP-binding cassette domain-containing protein [Ancalomicrobiaceae bacterium]